MPVRLPHRTDQTPRYIQSVHPRGQLFVEAQTLGAGTVPPGSSRVEMLRITAAADCRSAVPIHTITVRRRGLGANSDIAALYATHRGRRISRARSVSRKDGEVDLNVRNFSIAACEDEDIVIYADFASTASIAGEHRIELRGIDAGDSTVRIQRSIATAARTRKTAGVAVGQIDVDYLPLTRRVRFGARQIVSRFTLKPDNRDEHLLHAITFTNNGSASDSDLQNLYISFRNRRISTIAKHMSRDTVQIQFDPPFLLRKNNKLKFALRADVRASRSRTIQFVIEEPSDLQATPIKGR